MMKWIFSGLLVSLLTACSGSVSTPPEEAVPPAITGLSVETDRLDEAATPSPQPDFGDLFAETNQLFDQLEANTPIEVSPANASAQTMVLTVPSIF